MFASSLLHRSIGVITYILWVMFPHHPWLLSPAETEITSLLLHILSNFKASVCVIGWAALPRFWARPSRRPWPTSQLSTTTLTRSISATPASWPKTSYAVCWSRIQSKNILSFNTTRQEEKTLFSPFLNGELFSSAGREWQLTTALSTPGLRWVFYWALISGIRYSSASELPAHIKRHF